MHKIVLLPGDGIGPEIMAQTEKVMKALKAFGFDYEAEYGLIGGQAIDQTGQPLPEQTLTLAQASDGLLLAAVGGPQWDGCPTHTRPEKGLLNLRKHFDLFANLRPALLYPQLALASSLKPEIIAGLDLMIIRELTGGIYFGEPRGIEEKDGVQKAYNTMVYTWDEIERIAHVACEIALRRDKRLCSVDKANVLEVSTLWREAVSSVAAQYPGLQLEHMYVDNAAMQLVRQPKQFDVMVTSNMFGDILSDCAAQLTGSIGMLPSASLNQKQFGLYEPVHGSAPDIAGQDKANPLALILSLAMMLRYSLNEAALADKIEKAVEHVLEDNMRTLDIAQPGSTVVSCSSMGDAVVKALS